MYVLDYDEALDFYVGKLGMEVSADVDLGVIRWLTICVPGDNRHILLELPEGPGTSEQSAQEIRNLLSKGAFGLGFILSTDDCRATVATLAERGVEITQEPTEQPYGIDCGIRDPFGNQLRITQPAEQLGEFTDDVLDRYVSEAPDPR